MYSSKNVGPKMESWGTPTLTGYSFEDFPSRTWEKKKVQISDIKFRMT